MPATDPGPEYQFHPLANIFPLMSDGEYSLLFDDIDKRGLQEPIVIYQGMILDGRNRYNACKQLGRTFETKPYTGNDPFGFVFGANFHRRHLNESQRAMVAARIVTTKLGDNQHIKREGRQIDQPTAAEMLNVSVKSVQHAKEVCEKAAPELQAMVVGGKVAVSAAGKLVDKLTKEQQAKLAEGGDAVVRKAVKELDKTERRFVKPADRVKALKKQIDDFIAVWPSLNVWQKNFFIKKNQDELAKLLDEVKSKAGVAQATAASAGTARS